MNRIKLLSLAVYFFLIVIFFLPAHAAAADYRIDWLNITNRIYADHRGKVNRLQFVVTDALGNYILGTNGEFVDFNSVELYDSSDKKVSISDITFYPDYEFMGGSFDPVSGGWNYNSTVVYYEFQADILESLVPGEYELRLRCDDQLTYTANKTFNQIVSVPLISNKSYQIQPDSDGNVYFSWDIPESVLQLAESYDLIYRPGVAVYDGDRLLALLYPSAPIHVNMLFIPSSVVQWLAGKGSTFTFGVNVRTSDGQNRSHQIPLVVNDMLATEVKKKQVVVVPMF